jgi:hypothetical protein
MEDARLIYTALGHQEMMEVGPAAWRGMTGKNRGCGRKT